MTRNATENTLRTALIGAVVAALMLSIGATPAHAWTSYCTVSAGTPYLSAPNGIVVGTGRASCAPNVRVSGVVANIQNLRSGVWYNQVDFQKVGLAQSLQVSAADHNCKADGNGRYYRVRASALDSAGKRSPVVYSARKFLNCK